MCIFLIEIIHIEGFFFENQIYNSRQRAASSPYDLHGYEEHISESVFLSLWPGDKRQIKMFFF